MNNEIKEIYLSNLEWIKTHDNMGGVIGNLIFKDNMPYEEYEKLLKSGYFVLCNKDYITNLQTIERQYSAILSENAELQQENEILKKKLDRRYYKNEYERIKQENERLKERINQYENPDDMTLFYMWLDVKAKDKMKELQQENERLKDIVVEKDSQIKEIILQKRDYTAVNILEMKLEDYKSRCEEAIEYIKNNWYSKNTIDIDSVVIGDWRIDLLNILQNGDNNND